MVLLVADLNGVPPWVSTQVNTASSGQWDGHTLILFKGNQYPTPNAE